MDKLGPYILGPMDDEHQGIYTGDARELAKAIPNESVDLIFTDPVYDRIDDYRWLAETAARTLKPNGSLLTFCGIGYLPQTIRALEESLFYRWTLGAFQPNGPSRRGAYKGFSKWYACLWFDKNCAGIPSHHWPDMVYSYFVPVALQPGAHKWRKNPSVFLSWLRGFSSVNYTVWDPFVGGGTVPAVCKMLDRRWLAFEIDPDTAAMARERVCNTNPPLPIPEPEQLTFEYRSDNACTEFTQ